MGSQVLVIIEVFTLRLRRLPRGVNDSASALAAARSFAPGPGPRSIRGPGVRSWLSKDSTEIRAQITGARMRLIRCETNID